MEPETVIRPFLRAWFRCSSRRAVCGRIRHLAGAYSLLAGAVDPDSAVRPVEVPKMPGVDEDMRRWSFYMLLEHNVIVNRSIAAIVEALAAGQEPDGEGAIDPKRDVMPSNAPGPEQVMAFQASVDDYLARVAKLGPLRGTRTSQHPVFGEFDAHMWHCMFGFHLKVHLRQARLLAAGTG